KCDETGASIVTNPIGLPEILKAHQRDRWQRGDRVPVEAVLELHPNLKTNVAVVLDLIANECELRRECNELPNLNDYLARFGQFKSQIPQFFESSKTQAVSVRSQSAVADQSVPDVPGYEIISELGRGGMCVVYL